MTNSSPLDPVKGAELLSRAKPDAERPLSDAVRIACRDGPTQEAVLGVVKGLSAVPEIAVDATHKVTVTPEGPEPEGSGPAQTRELWFRVFHQWKNILGFKSTGNFSYSLDKTFQGGGQFNDDNLMGLLDTESLQVDAGNQVQTASGSLIIDRFFSQTPLSSSCIDDSPRRTESSLATFVIPSNSGLTPSPRSALICA